MTYSRTDWNQSAIVDALRAAGASVFITSGVRHGFPDLTVGFEGETYLVEVKVNKKSKWSDDEVLFWHTWRGHKAVVYTPEDALRIIGR